MSKAMLNVSKQLIEHLSHVLFLWAWRCALCVCVRMWGLGEGGGAELPGSFAFLSSIKGGYDTCTLLI